MDETEQYILNELAYSAGRPTWFELNGQYAIILQTILTRKDAEINLLREALGTIAATKLMDEINPDVDPRMMWIGCTQIASNALKEKE